jgi:hypothetical protein
MNLHLRRAATVAGVVWLRGELLLRRASVAAARWLFRIITHSFPSLSCCCCCWELVMWNMTVQKYKSASVI